MSLELDETHDPALTSWVETANNPATDFPVQNLPFGRFRREATARARTAACKTNAKLQLARLSTNSVDKPVDDNAFRCCLWRFASR